MEHAEQMSFGWEPRTEWPYAEPWDYEAILAERENGPRRLRCHLGEEGLADRILGGWLGRSVGCMLGKPVEGWTREELEAYLMAAGAWPFADYVPYAPEVANRCPRVPEARWRSCCRGQIRRMERDDDIDYTVLGLLVLERFGPDFRPEDVAETWLGALPYHAVYTAERAAYRNLVMGEVPPRSAWMHNPYREWIGAQIRADVYGYVNPGRPERAAGLAWRDASVSHTGNGLYGAMFAAAAVAAAFCTKDVQSIVGTALAEIPWRSRAAEVVRDAFSWHRSEPDWEGAWSKLHAKWGHLPWVHVLPNLGAVVLALLYGEGDFLQSVSLAVRAGWDTDCNGATVGSILGVMHGPGAIPEHLRAPLNDSVDTWVAGAGDCRLSRFAERTWQVTEATEEVTERE
ncbi:MAG: ADP-ribosylglycohydrolase family protein [Alicyclobacillus sp.]|nr:ADP-ribosylglycohydrolase family protein [Alicyclobacillus sp.]